MEKKFFLHELLKNTNVERPTPDLVQFDSFPSQDSDKLNKIETIEFIKQGYIPDEYRTESRDPIEHHDRVFEKEFRCIRYDIDDSYELATNIYISEDMKDIIIRQRTQNDTLYSALDAEKHLIGMRVFPEYPKGDSREAYIFSIQGLENGFATIIEYLDDETYRIILDTEMYFLYDPAFVHIPVIEPDVAAIRKRLIEGRVAYIDE